MRYAITILICLTIGSILPDLAKLTHTSARIHASLVGSMLHNSSSWLVHVVSATPQACWLVTIGIVLIALSWFVRYRATRRAKQSSW